MARKAKVEKERGSKWVPKVFERQDRPGTWMVDCGFKFGEKRLRFSFDTEAEARSKAEEKRLEFLEALNDGARTAEVESKGRTPFKLSALSAPQRNEIAGAMAKAGNDTATLIRALDFYNKHMSRTGRDRLLCRVYHDYLRGKRRSGKRDATVKDAHVKLRKFVKAFRKARIQDIATADVERWLAGRKMNPATFNAYRAAIVALFNYGIRREYIDRNPAEIVDVVDRDQGLPEIHSVAQVRAILNAACTHVPEKYIVQDRENGHQVKAGKMVKENDTVKLHAAREKIVPYLAIGYFAGLRPQNELENLDWKNIDCDDRIIRVDPATAKKRRQRYVDMSDNLLAWLAPYVRKSGKIGFSRRMLRAVRDEAKVEWPKDVMRHCFGSYHIAMHGDPVKTAAQMGHTRTSELFKSYRNLVKKSAAADYWNIVPDGNP